MKSQRLFVFAALGFAAVTLPSTGALATPGSGFAPSPIIDGSYGALNITTRTGNWTLNLKTTDSTNVGADRLTVQPNGYSGWHAHPGPVFVKVTQGSIVWYNGSDSLCPATTYVAGQSFIEPAYGKHNVKNASSTNIAEYVAITIKPAGFTGPSFRLDRGEPEACVRR